MPNEKTYSKEVLELNRFNEWLEFLLSERRKAENNRKGADEKKSP